DLHNIDNAQSFCSDSNSLILIYKLLAMYVVSAKRYQQCLCKETVR
ncbi:hypothetical protein HMPREF9144_2829, partial [Prevotella pallens ATCC 700821]